MSTRGNRRISRRNFLGAGGLSAAALVFGSREAFALPGRGDAAGYGPLVEDKGGLLDLPRGFQYRVISEQGTRLSGGKPVPGDHDGMAAYRGPGNTTVLVRNHELDPDQSPPVIGESPYDPVAPGGTTGILVGPDRKEIRDYVTSSGTLRNCSGGPTPWGTWLTCEETRVEGHGYVFEVLPDGEQKGLSDAPIRDMGFFSHEAIAMDPATGTFYLTEDDFRGGIPDDPTQEGPTSRASFLYRYLPNDRSRRPGALQEGGQLQALAIDEPSRVSNNADLAGQGQHFQARWIAVNPETAAEDARTQGALHFNRLEGADFAGGAFWFSDTAGGEERLGQTFRYLPATETLELFFESTSANSMQSPDNTVVTPFGDLWFCEDGDGVDRVMGITPERGVYEFARNRLNDSELAGCTFAPDGRTFYVNMFDPGMTFAIWGPFARISASRRRRMAHAAPPAQFAPKISGELAEAAQRHGMNPLEAAAYDRLGVPLA